MGHAALYHQLIVIQKYCHTTLSSKIAILIYLFHNYKKKLFSNRVDKNMEPFRDQEGFCVECWPGEVGLIVGEIIPSTKNDYSGYANSDEASNKKVINNLFKQGQKAFNSGDLVKIDYHGWVYFVDRLGDTFRWKGEFNKLY